LGVSTQRLWKGDEGDLIREAGAAAVAPPCREFLTSERFESVGAVQLRVAPAQDSGRFRDCILYRFASRDAAPLEGIRRGPVVQA